MNSTVISRYTRLFFLAGLCSTLSCFHPANAQEESTSQDVAQELERQHQRTLVEFGEDANRAQQLLNEEDFEGANRAILVGKVKLDQRRQYLSEAEYTQLSRQADDLIGAIEEAQIRAELAQEDRARREADAAQSEAERRERIERQRQIDESLRRVRALQMELKYDEALQVIDEILFLDELNPAALALRDIISTAQLYRDYARAQQLKEAGYSQLNVEAQYSMVPPRPNFTGPGMKSTTGIMSYPEDWPQLSFRRTGDLGFEEAPANRMVWQQLRDTQVPVNFTNNTFEQVMAYLESATGLNIYVDWKALELAGIAPEDEVSLTLQDVNVATAMDRVLDQLGDDIDRPQFDVQDGILTVTSDEAMRKRTLLLVYDIRDLLMQVPMFDNAPDLDLDSALSQGNQQGGGGGSGGGGGGGFGSGGGGGGSGGGGGGSGGGGGGGGSIFGEPSDGPDRVSREELVEQIVTIIQENVDPDGWRDLGGDTGSLQELNGNLIITNTPNNHRTIEGLLSQLREIRALQINVESRFLTVSNDWFEKIGVDLDLYFNTNNDMFSAARAVDPNFHLSDFFRGDGSLKDPLVFGGPGDVGAGTFPNTVPTGNLFGVPNAAGTGITYLIGPVGSPIRNTDGLAPIGINQTHNGLVNILADLDPGSFGATALASPALSVGLQFLDDIQVDLLIEATQADRRTVGLTAPRLTFFNGQRAWVGVITQEAFVSSLFPTTGDASGAFTPLVTSLNTGFVLDVEGVISADRRYVTMTVIFSFSEKIGEETAEITGAAGGGGIGGGAASTFAGSITLPEIRVSLVQTTVSVPDKGTVLLGGQRSVNELEVENGVPVLSKIPFVNRFFTNRLTVKDDSTLLILIRPEIIIQQENEDLLFPGLGDSLGGSAFMR